MILYQMMDDFDGDVEGDKFKLFGSIKPESIGKLIKKLEEKYKKPEREGSFKKSKDPLKLLKLKFVEGEITEEEYLHKKKLLQE